MPEPTRVHGPVPGCDFTGDGRGDFVAGVPGENRGGASGAGAVDVSYLVADQVEAGSILHHAVIGPEIEGASFGVSVACGDFDADGNDDLAIGSPNRDGQKGTVRVIFGDPNGVGSQQPLSDQFFSQNTIATQIGADDFWAPAEDGDRFGAALAAGDFDGDGYDDLAVGAPGESFESDIPGVGDLVHVGAAHVLRGGGDGLTAAQNIPLFPAAPEAQFGEALAVGDLHPDGHADLAIGIPAHEHGKVAVYDGEAGDTPIDTTSWTQISPEDLPGTPIYGDYSGFEAGAGAFGMALAFGDVNGDGADDLVVGSPTRDDNLGGHTAVGEVHVFRSDGNTIFTPGTFTVHGEIDPAIPGNPEGDDQFGFSVAAGDVDLDGRDDVVIGVGEEDAAFSEAGSVVVLTSASGVFRIDGTGTINERVGWAVAAWKPLANERARVVIGVPGATVDGVSRAGRVDIYELSGANLALRTTMSQATPSYAYQEQPEPGALTPTFWGDQDGENFGASLAG